MYNHYHLNDDNDWYTLNEYQSPKLLWVLPKGLNDMTMAEYLKSARMSATERAAWLDLYSIRIRTDLPFRSDESFDAHSHHAEYGASQH